MEKAPQTPPLDGDQIVSPPGEAPEGSVGSEGGSSLVGSPRHTEKDDEPRANGDRRRNAGDEKIPSDRGRTGQPE